MRPHRILTDNDPNWKVIFFVGNKRIVKMPMTWEKAKRLRELLQGRGVKVCIAHRIHGNFAPKGDGAAGQLWCGYCRAWRWFKIYPKDPIFGVTEIPICPYCTISVGDYWIRYWNGETRVLKRSRAAVRRRRRAS